MTTTTYYELNIVEGTDIVNPLIVDNPNYVKIDETMHNNAVAGVTLATEIANATVHAITRENSDCSVIRFIATSRWKAGDTATVDGVPVTALLPSGETLPDGAYVINANVLCILTGTNLTFYVGGKKVENASDVIYNDTNVKAELDALNGSVEQINASVEQINGSVEQINSNLNWKKIGSAAGTQNPISLPSKFNELQIRLSSPINCSFHIIKEELTDEIQYFTEGYYITANNNAGASIAINNTSIKMENMYFKGASVIAEETMDVYYR